MLCIRRGPLQHEVEPHVSHVILQHQAHVAGRRAADSRSSLLAVAAVPGGHVKVTVQEVEAERRSLHLRHHVRAALTARKALAWAARSAVRCRGATLRAVGRAQGMCSRTDSVTATRTAASGVSASQAWQRAGAPSNRGTHAAASEAART